MKIGDKIKELRHERALSQSQLAKIIGVSQKAIDYWERNIKSLRNNFKVLLKH